LGAILGYAKALNEQANYHAQDGSANDVTYKVHS
jgi:hypothetical protein